MILLERFTKKGLEQLIKSERFDSFPFYPISRHRAISHINNPNITDNTTLLILAFENENLVGYMGILTDILVHKNQEIIVGWFSTFYVHPQSRGKGIAQQLIAEACKTHNNNILITEFAPQTEGMYNKTGLFIYPVELMGMTYHFLSNLHTILPSKNRKWENRKPALRLLDSLINVLPKSYFKFRKKNTIRFQVSNFLDVETEEFIQDKIETGNIKRGIGEIRWILNYPWILSGTVPNDKLYEFTAFEPRFEYTFIKIYNEEKLVTVLFLTIRNSTAKLYYVVGNKTPNISATVLYQYAIDEKVSNLISFEADINNEMSRKFFLFKKKRVRKYFMHKNLYEMLGNNFEFTASSADGDAVFT